MKIKILTLSILVLSMQIVAQTKTSKPYSWTNLPVITKPTFRKDTFNIVRYGALANGLRLNTDAINSAISACNTRGGGTVLIPEGMWLSGPIYLKSNVNLHLTQGATLLFTSDKTKYKLVAGIYEGKNAARNESPINGTNLKNIGITGKGIVDANGDVWRAVNQSQLTPQQWKTKVSSGGVLSDDEKTWFPSEQFKKAHQQNKSMLIKERNDLSGFADMKDFLRPNLLVLKNCSQILLEEVTFQNSPAWCLHPVMCEDLTISDVKVKNPSYAQNGDGIDIESCTRFIVENSILDVGDDAICIKSGKDEEGRKRGIPSAQGIISGNTVYNGHGGVVIGSEMSGGARDIFIEKCTFIGTAKGLRFKSTRGRGGVVENIYARNVFMKDIDQEAIYFDMFYFVKFATDGNRNESYTVNEGTPVFKNMVFDNINCHGAKVGIFIRGLSEMNVQGIKILNSWLVAKTGVEMTDASNIEISNLRLQADSKKPLLSITNSENITFDRLQYQGAPSFLLLDGKRSEKIRILNSSLPQSAQLIEFKNGALANAVSYR